MTFDEQKRLVADLIQPHAPFVLQHRPGDVFLVVATERELRYAHVTPEEAAHYVEKLKAPGEVLAELRSDPAAITGGPGYLWVVAAVGDERLYFTIRITVRADGSVDWN